jgi:hypothetical protein
MKNESGWEVMGILSAVGIRPVSWSSEGSRVSFGASQSSGRRRIGGFGEIDLPIKMRSLEGFETSSLIYVPVLEIIAPLYNGAAVASSISGSV